VLVSLWAVPRAVKMVEMKVEMLELMMVDH
jgi:hypothetical protein